VIEGTELHTLMRVSGGEVDEAWMGQRLALADAAVTREVIETKRPTVVGSLRDPRLTPVVHEINRDFERKSWATLPLIVKDRVIGTVELVESDAERTFTQAELDTSAAICHAAALAIENAGLFEREQQAARETRLLNDIASRTAASLDLEEVVKAATDELGQLVSFDEYGLLLLEGATVGKVIGSRPQAEALLGVSIDDFDPGFVESIASEGVLVVRLPDDLPALASSPALEGLTSSVIIALPSETGLLGVLDLSSADPDAFSEVDRHLLERVGTQLSLAIKNAQLYDEIKGMHLGNLKALSSALNAKDYYTLGHAARVAAYTVMLGRQLGWTDDVLAPLEEAAYLHDIGKISISDRVLLKPSRLNQQEWEQMREHPVVSADIIRPLFPAEFVSAVRHHHERYDGTGYPDGLAAEEIPTIARAMAVVDAYDAMSCRRPYKAGLTYSQCLAELQACRGTQFDPGMVDAFLHVLDDIARRRSRASEIAAQAAQRIRGESHAALLTLDDEDCNAYHEIEAVLREVRDANPPTRFLTTHAQIEKRYVIGVDPEEAPSQKSHLGDEIFADEELPQVLHGKRPEVNTVFADEFGVWITGLAPIRDAAGGIVAAVAADLPALSESESEPLRGDGRQTFASMLQTAAVRLSRAEIDAITDALTGLYNHRYLHERLSEELHRARELQRPLSVLFCDLDHFKGYNDTNGHSAGDAVLQEVAHVIEQSVRNIDAAARYGGEEFVVILVETDRDEALAVAERIRKRLKEAGFTANGVPLTVSIGIAGYPVDADRREDLLNKADWAMYLAKRRGRDQVATFGEG
jgi:diguanylate cyclase (GGDEF)-like protein